MTMSSKHDVRFFILLVDALEQSLINVISFFAERLMLSPPSLSSLGAAPDDQPIGCLALLAGPVAESRFAPGCDRAGLADRRLAFTTTVGVINRVHGRTADVGTTSHVAFTTGLADVDNFIFDIADDTDNGPAALQYHADLT